MFGNLMDWQLIKNRLNSVCPNKHRFMPPCPVERIKWLEANWGDLPGDVRRMLDVFNGAELFIDAVPMVTLFGISTLPPQCPLVWPPACCIDHWLSCWRQKGRGWPIGRTNYDSLWILEDEMVVEWDQAVGKSLDEPVSASSWIQRILDEGRDYVNEGNE